VDLTAIVAALAAGEDHPGEPKTPPRARSNQDLRCSLEELSRIPRAKFAWSDEAVREAVALLSDCTVRVQPGERLDAVDAEPDDNRVLECSRGRRLALYRHGRRRSAAARRLWRNPDIEGRRLSRAASRDAGLNGSN
jgi:hypothetical protein